MVKGKNAGRRLFVTDIGEHFITGRMVGEDGRMTRAMIARELLDPEVELLSDDRRGRREADAALERQRRAALVFDQIHEDEEERAKAAKRAANRERVAEWRAKFGRAAK